MHCVYRQPPSEHMCGRGEGTMAQGVLDVIVGVGVVQCSVCVCVLCIAFCALRSYFFFSVLFSVLLCVCVFVCVRSQK